MNNNKLDAGCVWKQLDDDVVPQLKLSVIDHAVYSFLLRHSRLEGKMRIRFAISWLAHGVRLCVRATRHGLHRLFDHGALRLIECGQPGHVVHVRLPQEIPGVRVSRIFAGAPIVLQGALDTTDFLQNRALREAIHTRERGRCRRVPALAVPGAPLECQRPPWSPPRPRRPRRRQAQTATPRQMNPSLFSERSHAPRIVIPNPVARLPALSGQKDCCERR